MNIILALTNYLYNHNCFIIKIDGIHTFYIAFKRNNRSDEEIDQIAREIKVHLLMYVVPSNMPVNLKYTIYETQEKEQELINKSLYWLNKLESELKE